MAKEALTKSLLSEVFEATPHLLKFPKNKLWIDYDEEADVLYLSFQRPQKSNDLVNFLPVGLIKLPRILSR